MLGSGGGGIELVHTRPSRLDLVTIYHWHYSTQIRVADREGKKERGRGVGGKGRNIREKEESTAVSCATFSKNAERNHERDTTATFPVHSIIAVNYRVCFLAAFKLLMW